MAGLSATAEARAAWGRLAARRSAVLAGGTAVLLACFLLDLATGPALLPVSAVAASLIGLGQDPMVEAIVWSIRLPVALMALMVGAALGLTGAVMQTILEQPAGVELHARRLGRCGVRRGAGHRVRRGPAAGGGAGGAAGGLP